MDFRDNLHASAKQSTLDVGPLQQEANSSRFSLVGSIQAGLAEIPTPVVVGAGAVAGIAARLPGEFGIVGKIAAAGIGATVLGDAAVRTFSSEHSADNTSAYMKDAFTLGALSAGIIFGPKLFSSESSAGKAFTRDLAEQKQILSGAGFDSSLASTVKVSDNAVNAIVNGRESSNVVRLSDFMKVPQPGVKRVIQDVEIAQFDAATQTQIRESIAAMVKNGHKSEFLMLSKDGKVLIDREAIETAADIAAFKKP